MNQRLKLESLKHNILDYLQSKPQIKRWVIAYSGGLDSSVLLDVLASANQLLVEPKPVLAVHINHSLSPYADEWQNHCQKTANSLAVEFIAIKIMVTNQGQGLEAAAREQRYAEFAKLLQAQDALLTAHHQDDQAETLLLRLMRGAGVKGLAAMAEKRCINDSQLLRPFLNTSREQLAHYAKEHNLVWVNDESNDDTVYDRNFLRQEVIPLLTTRWQQVASRLAQAAEHLNAAQTLLNDLAALDFQQLSPQQARVGVSINVQALLNFEKERINNVLRYWCQQQNVALPNVQQLAQIHSQLLPVDATKSQAKIQWADCEMRRYQDRLFLMPQIPVFSPSQEHLHWLPAQMPQLDLQAYGAGVLSIKNSSEQKLTVHWRQGGERCTPLGRQHSQQLKKLLQEYQLETWLRDRVPLIYHDEELIAVADIFVCQSTVVQALTVSWFFPTQ